MISQPSRPAWVTTSGLALKCQREGRGWGRRGEIDRQRHREPERDRETERPLETYRVVPLPLSAKVGKISSFIYVY